MNNRAKNRIISGRLAAVIPKMDDATKRKMSLLMPLLVSIFVTMLLVSTASAEPYTVEKTILDISGNTSEENVTNAGDVIHYQIDVTNYGETTPESVNVTDDLDPTVVTSEPLESQTNDSALNAGETWTYLASYTVTQSDMDTNGTGSGVINNTVSVAIDGGEPINDSVEAPIINPSYTINKTVTDVAEKGPDANATTAGEIISYQIEINNTGNIDLTNVDVSDPLLDDTFEPTIESLHDDEILEVGETWTCIGSYAVTQADLNTSGEGDGFINNTASVDCEQLDPINDSAAVPVEQNPAYSIDKTVVDVAEKGPDANATAADDIISYQIDVVNEGNIDLNVSVNDSLIELPDPFEHYPLPQLKQSIQTFQNSLEEGNGILDVGETWTYFVNYTVNQSDLNSNGDGDGFINNTATVYWDGLDPINDSAAVPVEQNPAYTIDKIAIDVAGNGPEANVTSAGDVISYQIDINNTGNIDLTNVNVDDPVVTLETPTESLNADEILEVGEIWTYFGNYSVLQSDLNSNGDGDGFINNTATVDCNELDPINESAEVPVEQNPDYSFYKSVIEVDNGGDCIVDDAGDIIRYRVVLKNDGNIDLTGISVNDTLTSLSEPTGDDADPGVLNVGEIWKFYGNYTVTQEDINTNGGEDGAIENTATISCNELPSQDCSVSQPIAHDAYLRIYKSAIGTDNIGDCIINEAGDVIEYQIAVKNDGKVDLTGVSVNDPMISLEGPVESKVADGVLTVGELWVYTGNYTVIQEDIDNNGGEDGYIDNTATVSCNELSDETSSIGVPIVIPNNLKEGTDSESNNTTVDDETNNTEEENSSNNDNNSDNENDGSSSGSSSGSSHKSGSSGGTGTARVISNNDETDKVNESSVEENITETQPESTAEVIPENTESTEEVQQQTENEGSTSTQKESPGFEMIYGIIGLLGVFLYRRK